MIGQVRNALASEDRDSAVREAHTLKGLAGNIGATELQRRSGELEQAVSEKKEDDEMLQSVEQELSKVIHALAVIEDEVVDEERKQVEWMLSIRSS